MFCTTERWHVEITTYTSSFVRKTKDARVKGGRTKYGHVAVRARIKLYRWRDTIWDFAVSHDGTEDWSKSGTLEFVGGEATDYVTLYSRAKCILPRRGLEPGCCCIMYSSLWSAFANPSGVKLAASEKRSFSHFFLRPLPKLHPFESSISPLPVHFSRSFCVLITPCSFISHSIVRNVSLRFTRAFVSRWLERHQNMAISSSRSCTA